MKVLVLAPRPLWPVYDGGTVATVRCIRGLAAAGANVSVLSMKTEKHTSVGDFAGDNQPPFVTFYKTVDVDTRIKPFAMLRNLLFSDEPYDLSRFRSPGYSDVLRRWLNDREFDIIQCEGLSFAQYLREIKDITGIPVVLRAHNLEHRIREMMAAGTRSPLRRAYLQNLSRRLETLERKAASQFDAVVPISEPDFRWFSAAAGGKHLFLSETGVDEAALLPEPAVEDLRVGFIGAMNWQPNIDGLKWFIADVWPGVLKQIPAATLHIAGRGLHQQAASLLQGKNIVLDGEPDDALTYMASNHVMISPLFAGSGLRIKIIEAMSVGRPVVATPVAVAGLQVENGRQLAVAADPGSFCNEVVRLLKEPARRASMGSSAVQHVWERYDNSIMSERLIEFYTELIHGS